MILLFVRMAGRMYLHTELHFVRKSVRSCAIGCNYGIKNAVIRAKSNGNGKLTYKTSNPNVIVIDKSGKMIVKNTGKAIITITAGETS